MNNFKFEKVSRFQDVEFDMPVRKTAYSAGYDMVVAEDIVIYPYAHLLDNLYHANSDKYENGQTVGAVSTLSLQEMATLTKKTACKPSLVSTGVKCKIPEGHYLQLSVRSSCPLKHWLIMANGNGIIDTDYYNNPDNEGEIFFQIINLSPWPIQLKKGDIIGQGILLPYRVTEDDNAIGERIGGFGSTSQKEVSTNE